MNAPTAPADDVLRIGGRTVSRAAARDYAARYLTEGVGWAYPSYDGYQADSARGPLVDGDFLAPVLLNVSFLNIRTYEALQARMPELQSRLAEIPLDLELADSDADSLVLLGGLFSVLDGAGLFGVGGTVLAKVMHRKRPAFIPLYDERVRTVYQDGDGAPVPPEPGRTWERFMVRFGEAVRDDLVREHDFYREVAALAPGPPITALRALDIVAWWAGGSPPQTASGPLGP